MTNRNTKGRFLPGHSVNAKPEGKHFKHRTITLPAEVDALVQAYMETWNLNRSSAIVALLQQSIQKEDES